MDTDTALHHRRSIRLKDYDYRQEGVYCVTICTEGRVCLFGRVSENGEMRLNEYGRMVAACWDAIPHHFPHVELDAFIVMPNHVHGMIVIANDIVSPTMPKSRILTNTSQNHNNVENVGAQHAAPLQASPLSMTPGIQTESFDNSETNNLHQKSSNTFARVNPGSLGAMVRSFKSAVTREINRHRNTPGQIIWQRNYYEQLVRDDRMLNHYRQYIEANPAQWSQDRYFQEIA